MSNRFGGAEAPALLDFIMSKDCPVSALLSDAGRARLQEIKQEAIEKVKQEAIKKAKKPGG